MADIHKRLHRGDRRDFDLYETIGKRVAKGESYWHVALDEHHTSQSETGRPLGQARSAAENTPGPRVKHAGPPRTPCLSRTYFSSLIPGSDASTAFAISTIGTERS